MTFVVFIMASRGVNEIGASEKIRTFLEAAVKYNPVNIGNGPAGSLYPPEKAATYMAKFCACGAFNTTRAIRILNEARMTN